MINQVRGLQGWSIASAAELEPISRIWWMEFSRHNIPAHHYLTLFQRAHDARVRHIQQAGHKNAPAIDATSMIAHWTGEHGLAAEIRRREIASGRLLPEVAASDCDLCFGSGWMNPDGKGARRCERCRG